MANHRVPLAVAGAALVAAACAAAPNPAPRERASASDPRASAEALVVGRVGERTISVEDFLARLWMRAGPAAREVLEQLVLAELSLREAARIGLVIEPDRVNDLLAESEATLRERLAASAAQLTVDEHIRQNLGMDPGFYRGQLETDAIVQLAAERCVRAYTLGSSRAQVALLDLDAAAAAEVTAALEAGEPFDALAARHGGAEELVLVRSESNDLARLAFATEAGQVAGPMVREGHHVLVSVEAFLDPVEGDWEQIGARVEASLAAEPVGDREFVQWRHRMVERYAVDLGPFLALVGDAGS